MSEGFGIDCETVQDDAILAHNPKPSPLDGTQIDQQRLARCEQLPLHGLDPDWLWVAEFGVFGKFRRDTTIERFQAFSGLFQCCPERGLLAVFSLRRWAAGGFDYVALVSLPAYRQILSLANY